MNVYQFRAYAKVAERREGEQTVRLMNAVGLAFGGTQTERQNFVNQLLGLENRFDSEEIANLFGMASEQIISRETDEIRQWARAQFEKDTSGFLSQIQRGLD